MALQYITSPEKDFSQGIDARSAENQIDPGFVRDLLNADIVEKRARKRKGYQGFAGNVPVRVTEMVYNNADNEVCFTLDSTVTLDSAISLETVRSSPLVVYGRSSTFTSGQGPFTTSGDTAKYYPKFSTPIRKPLTAPSGTLTIEGTEHGLGTTNLLVSVVESLDLVNRSYQRVLTDTVSINESSFDIAIDYTTYVNRNAFVYYADKSTVTGSSYVHAATGVGTGSQTISIPSGTHNLANLNIIPQIYQDTGSARSQVIPDTFEVATSGDITITVTNGTGSAVDYYVILSAAPTANQASGVVGASSTGTVVISNVERPWVFFGIYLEQTPGGTKEIVYPDLIDYDDDNLELTLTFTNSASTARNFIVHFEYGEIRSNQLCVEDSSVTVDGTDERPQITIWGLEHDEIYDEKVAREAWVTHLDSYRRSGEQRMVCGLGGNLFAARTYSEAGTSYKYPLVYPRLTARTSSSRVLGPLFWDTGETPARSRGFITSSDSAAHWAAVSSVEYDSANGWTKYTIQLPSKAILDSSGSPTTLASVISTTTNLEDHLTVQGMSYARHNGTFRIRQVQDGANLIRVWVENEDNSSDFDDLNTGGEAGVFTDQFSWTASGPFIPGDLLISEPLGDSFICTAMSTSGSTTVSDGLVGRLEIAAGVQFTGRRTSSVVPLRSSYPSATASADNVVRGDMLSFTGIARLLRVLHVNADQDRTVNIAVSGETATVTLQSGDTSYLAAGQQVVLLQAGVYTGIHTIDSIESLTEFTFTTDETVSVTGATLVGETMEIDEELEWEDTTEDTNFFRADQRWIPLEAPDDSYNQTPSTYVRHFDVNSYSDQPFLRSTMAVDNLYLTNYDDEVYKFDGTSIQRAGLPQWQPGLFLTQESSAPATIVTNLRSISYSARTAAEGKLTITAATQNVIPVGQTVRLTGSTQSYTVKSYFDDGATYYLLVDRALDASVSASGTIAEIGTFRYYYRLNAVDANDNLIASAVAGHQDHVVEMTGNFAVRHKIVGLPAWDVLDYDRLEVQIYRTKMNTSAPYYLVTTLPLDFDNAQGYVTYVDSFSDSDLSELDVVNTALKGSELGTSWTGPLRSKYITSLGNRLVLGNIRDYSQLDIQIVAEASTGNTQFNGDSLLFRRDNTDSSTSTDMVNRVRYQWVNGFSGTPSAVSPVVGGFSVSGITQAVVAGDWIYLTYSTVATTGRDPTLCGWWQIASVSGSGPYTATITIPGFSALTVPDRYVVATDPTDVPVLLGTDGNLGMVNGDSFDLFDAMRRMSMAINATMRQTNTALAGYTEFVPWLSARGGNDLTPAGRLLVRQERSDDVTFELEPTFSGYELFVNSIKRTSGSQISASTKVFPSRIIVSYENYPEIFDNPTATLDSESDSAIDINSADGQEITGIIPFFGEAAFGAAQQSGILVVFKSNSIYLVDINQKIAGQNAVQRIETEGLGCTAPYSIAVTKNGINFANESGVYCLRRNQAIQYIGRYMERNWTERVDLDQLELCHGHHFGVGRAYKLSVPITGDEDTDYVEPSEAYVYNHTGESEGRLGAWSRYDNHPAIGWANLAPDAFFASTNGRVFAVRQSGTATDSRDDNEGIHFRLDARPTDFGNSGIRKVVDRVVAHYRNPEDNEGTTLSYALDLEQEYSDTTPISLAGSSGGGNLGDVVAKDIQSVSHSLGRRRATYLSVRIENSTIDESVEVAGLDFRVAGLSDKGIREAAATQED